MSYTTKGIKMCKYGPAFTDINGYLVNFRLVDNRIKMTRIYDNYVNICNGYKYPEDITRLYAGDYIYINGLWAMVLSISDSFIKIIDTFTHDIKDYYPLAGDGQDIPKVYKLMCLFFENEDFLLLYDLLDRDKKMFVTYLTSKGYDLTKEKFQPLLYICNMSNSVSGR